MTIIDAGATAGADSEDRPTTPSAVKAATQELLKYGVLDASTKPRLHAAVLAHRDEVAAILEPLDLAIRIDEVRGLVVLLVSPELTTATDDRPADEWNHPLVRRHRLRMDQSLLLAILRRHHVEHERTSSDTSSPTVAFDDLLSELQPFLGDRGSELEESNRLRRLLDGLKDHGVVSEVVDDVVTIRPLICHLADPESLEVLLAHYRRLAADSREEPHGDGGPRSGLEDDGRPGDAEVAVAEVEGGNNDAGMVGP